MIAHAGISVHYVKAVIVLLKTYEFRFEQYGSTASRVPPKIIDTCQNAVIN